MKKLVILFTFIPLFASFNFPSELLNGSEKSKIGEESKWVDLGLSVLWARYNVGATSPEEYGGYYAWGETEEKSSYTIENYKFSTFAGYDESGEPYYTCKFIGNDISTSSYDVAHVKWGYGARMPRIAEIQELLNKCSWVVNAYKGVKGMAVTGPNNNSIFLPFAGYYEEEYKPEGGNLYGGCWSSTLLKEEDNGNIDAYSLYFEDYDYIWKYLGRFYGHSVRPVKDK